MKTLRFLFLAAAPAFAATEPSALFQVESYSVPAAIYLKIPSAMREDHALFRLKLREQLGKGSVHLRDRVGGSAPAGQRVAFTGGEEWIYPTEYEDSDSSLYGAAWEMRNVGSRLELEPNWGAPSATRISYERLDPNPPMVPILKDGPRQEVERSKFPFFSRIQISTALPIAPVTLMALAPEPDPSVQEERVLVTFLVASQISKKAPPRIAGGQFHFFEVLGLNGASGGEKTPPAQLMKTLLRNPDAYEFTLGITQALGQKSAVDSVQEFTHPTESFRGPNGPVPTALETLSVGDSLDLHLKPAADGVKVTTRLIHDFRDPILPTVPGKRKAPIDKTMKRFALEFPTQEVMRTGTWVLLAEKPLSDALGDDPDAKGRSCYLFARVSILKD